MILLEILRDVIFFHIGKIFFQLITLNKYPNESTTITGKVFLIYSGGIIFFIILFVILYFVGAMF